MVKAEAVWEVKTSAYDTKFITVPRFFSKKKILGSELDQYFYYDFEVWMIDKLRIPPRKTVKIKITVELEASEGCGAI